MKVFLIKQWTLKIVSFLVPSRLVLGFDLLVFVFGKLPIVFCTWLCMFSATVVVPYNLFVWWAQGYSSSSHRAVHTFFYGMLFTLFQIAGLGFGPTYVAVSYALPPASRFIVILEQVSPCPVSSVSWDTSTFIYKVERVLLPKGVKCYFYSLN